MRLRTKSRRGRCSSRLKPRSQGNWPTTRRRPARAPKRSRLNWRCSDRRTDCALNCNPKGKPIMTDTYAKRAQRVVDGLAQATLLSNANKDDQALALLASLKPDVASLREAAKGMHEVVKSEEDLAQRKLHSLLQPIPSTVATPNKTPVHTHKTK